VAAGLPWSLRCLVSGVVVDRVPRLPLMMLMQLVCAVVGAAVVIGVLAGWRTIHSLLAVGAAGSVPAGMLADAVVTLTNVVAVSLRQLVTPEVMLGRVTSIHRFLCWGALPLAPAWPVSSAASSE
jgi:hypothetical protein